MNVLRNMIDAVDPGGLVLDLQVIRPNPVVESGEERICEIWGEPLFAKADAARGSRRGDRRGSARRGGRRRPRRPHALSERRPTSSTTSPTRSGARPRRRYRVCSRSTLR
ncbi:MAG: hypothetical protein ACXVRK_04395 [Gaiellaceae bacterium]